MSGIVYLLILIVIALVIIAVGMTGAELGVWR